MTGSTGWSQIPCPRLIPPRRVHSSDMRRISDWARPSMRDAKNLFTAALRGRATASRPPPGVDADDAALQRLPAHGREAGVAHRLGEIRRARKLRDRSGQV